MNNLAIDWRKLPLPATIEEHGFLMDHIQGLKTEEWRQWMAAYGLADLHFFTSEIMSSRRYPKHQYVMDRCRDIQGAEDDVLDIWSREHLKTWLKTVSRNLQRVARDPDETIGIISHIRPQAKKFLRTVKVEQEENKLLPELYPDVFWEVPKKQSKKWSEDDGLVVNRTINVNEATFEAHGFVEGLPTGSHFRVLNFDDIITEKHVGSPEMIAKTTEMYELALSLGIYGGITTYAGTFYDPLDTYSHIKDLPHIKLRCIPCWDADHNSIFYPVEYLQKKLAGMNIKTFGIQWECDPMSGQTSKFSASDLRYYGVDPKDVAKRCKIMILADPANEKHKKSDFTVFWVIGLGPDRKFYVLDIVRDKLNPAERTDTLFKLIYEWGIDAEVRYEQYGMMTDIFYAEQEMDRRMCHFELIPVGGQMSKIDRINGRVGPMLTQHELYFPMQLLRECKYRGGAQVDMVRVFVEEELKRWPLPYHDDLLDSLARLQEPDLPLHWPAPFTDQRKDRWDELMERARHGSPASSSDWQLAVLG